MPKERRTGIRAFCYGWEGAHKELERNMGCEKTAAEQNTNPAEL